MKQTKISISDIETFLYGIINGTVTNNTFINEPPTKDLIPNEWKDMCVIDIPNGINDWYAFGRGSVFIWLYARPMSSGRKNVAIMSALEKKMNEVIAKTNNPKFSLNFERTYTEFDEIVDWHCNIIEYKLILV